MVVNSVPGSHGEPWQLLAQEEKSSTRCGVGEAGEARDTGSLSAQASFPTRRASGSKGPRGHSTPPHCLPACPRGGGPPHEARPRLQAESPLLEHDLFGAYTPGPHR